ncbi:MAG TPA: hypothetical protein VHX92_00355 [Rhizomicrobium sp.]|jgi:hypothetical protein|nr:hypothetical protein [Rhizomicrobium sp.]
MAIAAKRIAKVNGAIVWRLIGALLLLAFSFQSFLAQTHIHETAAATAQIYQPGHSKPPVGNSPFDCPFCQAVAHATSFLMPGTSLPFLAPGWVKTTTLHNFLAGTGTATKYNWQSRAPPSRR